jgi:hypothetical protein
MSHRIGLAQALGTRNGIVATRIGLLEAAIGAGNDGGVATLRGSAKHDDMACTDGGEQHHQLHGYAAICASREAKEAASGGPTQHQCIARNEGEVHYRLHCETAISACAGAEVAARTGPAQHHGTASQDGEEHHQLHCVTAISACEGDEGATCNESAQHHGWSCQGEEGASRIGPNCASGGSEVATRMGPTQHHQPHSGFVHTADR